MERTVERKARRSLLEAASEDSVTWRQSELSFVNGRCHYRSLPSNDFPDVSFRTFVRLVTHGTRLTHPSFLEEIPRICQHRKEACISWSNTTLAWHCLRSSPLQRLGLTSTLFGDENTGLFVHGYAHRPH